MKYIPALVFCFSLPFSALGQLQKILHQTFEVDSFAVIQLDVYGEYQVELWAGNNIMTETSIKLYQASEGILNHLVEAKRYDLETEKEGQLIKLFSVDKERPPIKTHKGECSEVINLRIFVPDSFGKTAEHSWSRPLETVEKDND